MPPFIYFIFGAIVGGAAMWVLTRKKAAEVRREKEDVRKKRENLEKIRVLFAERKRLANNEVEKFLGVSDATATRYLDELEKEGFIRQVGRTGKHVYYERLSRSEEVSR